MRFFLFRAVLQFFSKNIKFYEYVHVIIFSTFRAACFLRSKVRFFLFSFFSIKYFALFGRGWSSTGRGAGTLDLFSSNRCVLVITKNTINFECNIFVVPFLGSFFLLPRSMTNKSSSLTSVKSDAPWRISFLLLSSNASSISVWSNWKSHYHQKIFNSLPFPNFSSYFSRIWSFSQQGVWPQHLESPFRSFLENKKNELKLFIQINVACIEMSHDVTHILLVWHIWTKEHIICLGSKIMLKFQLKREF